MTGRRLLYDEARVRLLLHTMREEMDAMAERYVAELRAMGEKHLAELSALRAELDELRAVSLARSKAELEVAELRRLREIGRARAVERDPALPMN